MWVIAVVRSGAVVLLDLVLIPSRFGCSYVLTELDIG